MVDLRWFESGHLPVELQVLSSQFEVFALGLDSALSDGPEKSVALRKLLEAKDAAVRQRLADL